MAYNISEDHSLTEEQSVRVEDYLKDKLQTSADLENLDILLRSVRNQQDLLAKQVSLNCLGVSIGSIANLSPASRSRSRTR